MKCIMIYENTLVDDLASTFHIIKMYGYRLMLKISYFVLMDSQDENENYLLSNND